MLLLAVVMSEKNASIWVVLLMSRKFRCGSTFTNQTSPIAGIEGGVVLLGTFNEA